MKILEPVGKYGTSLWGNVRPLLIFGAVILGPAILCVPLLGLFVGSDFVVAVSANDIAGWLLAVVLFPIAFAAFMGTWCFMWGIVIDRQLKKRTSR